MTSGPPEGSARGPSRLLEELRQTRPFRSRAQEAFLALLRTADLSKNRFSDLFGSEGVTFQQYNVLRILRGAGPAGLPTLEVGSRMIERTPGITRILDRLEAKGWVRRERSSEDRRRVWCRISPLGLALLERLDAPVDANDRAIFDAMAEADVEALLRILDQLRARLADLSREPD
ncbi:MAG: MarR family transcriptional regulator [Longimicrobiales bacterium]|nr:MarR family transcriptional regulator [Longimicrobiales bacterium]